MRNTLFVFAALFAGCGGNSIRYVEVPGDAGSVIQVCDSDSDCPSGQCDPESGYCVRTEVVERGCADDTSCDDADPATSDSCVDGVCHHATTVVEDVFDPSAPERQDARIICEQPIQCTEVPETPEAPRASLYWTESCAIQSAWPKFWDDRGYPLFVEIQQLDHTLRRHIRVRPVLRVGDPVDQYQVTYKVGTTLDQESYLIFSEPVTALTRTIEEEGIEVDLTTEDLREHGDYVLVMIRMEPVGEIHSRTIQWGLGAGSIVDEETGTEITSCHDVGKFMRVPFHGMLHLGGHDEGGAACDGVPAREDMLGGRPRAYVEQWLNREVSDPEVVYVGGWPDYRAFTFQGKTGIVDWFAPANFLPWEICASVAVVPDGTLDSLERRRIGVHPGLLVSWNDREGVRHFGIADRGMRIRDYGTGLEVQMALLTMAPACTLYPVLEGAPFHDPCFLDLDLEDIVSEYEVAAGDLSRLTADELTVLYGSSVPENYFE